MGASREDHEQSLYIEYEDKVEIDTGTPPNLTTKRKEGKSVRNSE